MKHLCLLLLCLCGIGLAFDAPHLSYSPGDKMRLELGDKLPKKFRLCAEGEKFRFCSPWIVPKTRTVDVDLAIPLDTPNAEYNLMYEDGKQEINLRHHFTVEK
jgi:hypothetical protein